MAGEWDEALNAIEAKQYADADPRVMIAEMALPLEGHKFEPVKREPFGWALLGCIGGVVAILGAAALVYGLTG